MLSNGVEVELFLVGFFSRENNTASQHVCCLNHTANLGKHLIGGCLPVQFSTLLSWQVALMAHSRHSAGKGAESSTFLDL